MGCEHEKSPYERGRDAGLRGDPPPPFPKSDSDWAARLYHRGWEKGTELRLAGWAGKPEEMQA
jgi:hypothetical protein